MLLVNGKKMAKSSGNFFTVQDLIEQGHHPDAIRLALLQTHYRQPLNWTADSLSLASSTLQAWRDALLPHRNLFSAEGTADFHLGADLNTPLAITELHQLACAVNRGDVSSVPPMVHGLRLLGLMTSFLDDRLTDGEARLIQRREQRRAQKDFVAADGIRETLRQVGLSVKDGKYGTEWWRA